MPHFLLDIQCHYICGKFKVKLLLYLIKYQPIDTFIELSLKQTQRLKIGLTNTAADGEFVG